MPTSHVISPSQDTLWDCVIIGGGLAGLAAGITLGRSGYRVLITEKNHYPKHKVCGEYISLESEWVLKQLLPAVNFGQFPLISQLEMSTLKGVRLTTALPLGGIGISRYWLDHALVTAFSQLPHCEILEDTAHALTPPGLPQGNFEVQTRAGYKIQSRLVFAAYGKWANLDNERSQKVDKKGTNFVGVKYHLAYDMPENLIGLHLFEGGYAGISKVEDGRTCFCYMTTASQLQKAGGKVSALEKQVLSANPVLQKIINEGQSLYDSPLVISQIRFHSKALVHDQAFRIGDAAGMIPPLCGNGMSMALRSGWEAANESIAFLSGQKSLNEAQRAYSQQYQRAFGLRLKAGRMLQNLVLKPQLAEPVLALMQASPWLSRRIIQLTHGAAWSRED